MDYYNKGLKKIISVSQKLDFGPRLHSEDEEEGNGSRSMEHSVAIEQAAE